MSVITQLRRLAGGTNEVEESDRRAEGPSHVCRSCGEEYFTERRYDIDTCRSCGGVKVERR